MLDFIIKEDELQELIRDQKLKDLCPEDYVRYPAKPRLKYIPTSNLMHMLIFKTLELHMDEN